jgi:GTP-binding protein EngB required for normal cell division
MRHNFEKLEKEVLNWLTRIAVAFNIVQTRKDKRREIMCFAVEPLNRLNASQASTTLVRDIVENELLLSITSPHVNTPQCIHRRISRVLVCRLHIN